MAIIEVDHVTKEFRLGELESLAHTLKRVVARIGGRRLPERTPFKALDDVDFTVEQGEVLGIIGQNGAGKSTLLKMLAGISVPTRGRVAVRGTVAPLIELGAGMVPDLTGRENIVVNAAILGMRRREIERKFDEIVAFAELEEFIDTPVKRYSSGMKVRLGFSIATCLRSDILIIDEVLAVGDLAFQRKCFDRMEEMIKAEGSTVLLVSHNIRQVERLCSRVILLDRGAIVSDGGSTDVCNLFIDRSNQKIQSSQASASTRHLVETDEVKFHAVDIFDETDAVAESIEFLHPARIRFTFEALQPVMQATFYIGLHTTDFVYLTAHNTAMEPVDLDRGTHSVELEIKSMTLLPGVYCILAWIGNTVGRTVFHAENLRSFRVFSSEYVVTRQRDRALFHIDGKWNFQLQSPIASNRTAQDRTESTDDGLAGCCRAASNA